MSTQIVEAMKGIAHEELKRLRMPELGVVTNIYPHSDQNDKDNYQCDVRLKNLDVELRRVQITTQVIGLAGIPRVGDLVLLVFVGGDFNQPIIVGRLYNDEDRPPVNDAEEIVYVAPHAKNPDVRRIYLEFPDGMSLTITDEQVNLNAGDTTLTIQKDGDVVVEAKGKVTVRADGDASFRSKGKMTLAASSIEINSRKALELESGTEMKMHASDVKMEADKNTEIKAQIMLNLESQMSLVAKAKQASGYTCDGPLIIRGQVVSIN